MKIEWTIKKKRGRFRPVLEYHITFEKWEKDLNPEVVSVKIKTGYYSGPDSTGMGVSRDEEDSSSYLIKTREDEAHGRLALPYKGKDDKYPEVADAFAELVLLHEAALREAYDISPLDESGCLNMSDDLKKYVAPGLTAERMKNGNGD